MFDEQGDQHAADAAVAIEEWMDRLELHVCEPGLDQRRERVVRVQPLLEGGQSGRDLIMWQWHETSVARPRTADPVLAPPAAMRAV